LPWRLNKSDLIFDKKFLPKTPG